jgi:hypothetical protein
MTTNSLIAGEYLAALEEANAQAIASNETIKNSNLMAATVD